MVRAGTNQANILFVQSLLTGRPLFLLLDGGSMQLGVTSRGSDIKREIINPSFGAVRTDNTEVKTVSQGIFIQQLVLKLQLM